MSAPTLLELLKSRKEKADAGKRPKTEKIVDGKHKYRILPAWAGEDRLPNGEGANFQDFAMHFVKHDKTIGASLCRAKTYGEPCDICDLVSAGLNATSGESDKEANETIYEARSTARILMNMIRMDAPENERVPKMYEVPKGLFDGDIMPNMITFIENGLDMCSLDKGFEIEIEKSGTGKQTEYKAVVIPIPAKPLPVEILKKAIDMSEWVRLEGLNTQGHQKALALASVMIGSLTGTLTGGMPALVAPAKAQLALGTLEDSLLDDLQEDALEVSQADLDAIAAKKDEAIQAAKIQKALADAEVRKAEAKAAAKKEAEPAVKEEPALASISDADLDDLMDSLG